MKGTLEGGRGVAKNCYLLYSCPCCFDKKGVKSGKRGMKYRAMKVRNEEPSPLAFPMYMYVLLLSGISRCLVGF